MSEEWAMGDLALCVATALDVSTKSGSIYIVERVWAGTYGTALAFVGINNGNPSPLIDNFWGHAARRFRKIPPHTPDAEDEITIRLMREKPAIIPIFRYDLSGGKHYIRDPKTGHWVPLNIGWTDE